MKLAKRFTLFSCYLLLLTFCFLPVHAENADNPKPIMDIIPYESLAYVSISNLDTVLPQIFESPEWKELSDIEQVKEALEQANQGLAMIPMLVGISPEEVLNAFGHKTVLSFMGMEGNMPIACLIADVQSYKDEVEYGLGQLATLPALMGGAMIEEKEYRDVPHTAVGNKDFEVKYGFVDNFLIAGINGGFEKLVDLYKDGGESIKDSPNFQFMEQKVSLSSEISVYADIERAAPILEQLANESSGEEEENQFNVMMKEIVIKSAKAFAFSLSLSGQTHEMYLHLKPEEPDPISDLALAPHPPMSTMELIPFADGALVGVHIGHPVEMLDKGLKLVEFLDKEGNDLESQISQLENGLQLNLREDLLSALTGEIALIGMLPKEQVNLKKNKLQIAKLRPVILIGVKDRDRLEETAKKLSDLASLEISSSKEQSHKGTKIYKKVVLSDNLIPGVAITPSYSFRDDLLIISNSTEWVKDTIDLFESSGDQGSAQLIEVKENLSESRILIYVDAADVANFVIEQDLIEDVKLPEAAEDRLESLGSIAANFSAGPDGLGIKIISTSDDNWATKILNGVLIGVYANIASKQEKAEGEELTERTPVE